MSEAERIRQDAMADMQAEGLDTGESQEIAISRRWVGSFCVRNHDGDVEHGLLKQDADSHGEAVGLSYLEVSDEFSSEDGWFPPAILMDEEPVLMVPGLPLPVRPAE